MNRDELTATSIMELENGERFELDYYVRTSVLENHKIFALRVDQKETESGRLIETESSLAFSEDYDGIRNMTIAFADGLVTPAVLIEMCDEWVNEFVRT